MRFLVDECTAPAVARWLTVRGHTVFSVFDQARGLGDDAILQKAVNEEWVIITAYKDFGAMIYRDQRHHFGIVLLRLEDERASRKVAVIERLLDQYHNRILGHYIVGTLHCCDRR